jgi:predicted phage terminase large subunit-like protein
MLFQNKDQKAFNLAASSLKAFCLLMIPGYEVAPHHELILNRVEALLKGKIKKLAIITPPRHGKTTIASIALPAYFLGRNPHGNVITVSYGAELSEGWGRRVRGLLLDPNFERVFPKCSLSQDSQAAGRFNTTRGGEYIATGRGGPITGRGADLLVLDDLVKDFQESNSEITCRGITEWLRHVALTRLSRDGKILAISTRWSERDPMGWLLKEQKGFEVLHLPAISEGAGDPLGRPEGATLWESQYPKHVLENIRIAIGPSAWQSLYQGNPTAAQGQIFKRIWFRRFQAPPERFTKIVQSWDTAFKANAANDYSVCTTWGTTNTGFYLLHCWRDRVEFPELKKQVAALADAWSPSAIFIEDKASGQSLIQELKTATRFPVLPVKADADKTTRANAVTAFFAAGKVYFPDGADWLSDVEDELASFPNAVHDDIVDSVAQALNYLRGDNWVLGLLELQSQGQMLQALEPPKAVSTTPMPPKDVTPTPAFGSSFSIASSSRVPPTLPPRAKTFESTVCPFCKTELTIVDEAADLAHCRPCNQQIKLHERSRLTLSISQTRGEYLAGRERQPGRFGRGKLFGRFGR